MIAGGGLIGLTCARGRGGLALLYTRTRDARGYRLISIYDDLGLAAGRDAFLRLGRRFCAKPS